MARPGLFETRRLASTSFGASAVNIGAVTSAPVLVITAFNTSDVSVYLQWNDNQIEIPAGATQTFDSANAPSVNEDSSIIASIGTQFTALEVTGAGTSGHIILNLSEQR